MSNFLLNVLQKFILQSILPERGMCQVLKENKITPHMSLILIVLLFRAAISRLSCLSSFINFWIEYGLTYQVYLFYRFAHFSPQTSLARSLPDYGCRYLIEMKKCLCWGPRWGGTDPESREKIKAYPASRRIIWPYPASRRILAFCIVFTKK